MALIGVEAVVIPLFVAYTVPFVKDKIQRVCSRKAQSGAVQGLAQLRDNSRGIILEDEEEIIVAGKWVHHLERIAYDDEPILRVREYAEGDGTVCTCQDGLTISSHHYIVAESASWAYVFEKWRDGASVLRFRSHEKAIYHRGRYFAQQNHGDRKNPRLVQEISPSAFPLGMTTDTLLLWSATHASFKKFRDNCHTYAANLAEVCGGKGSSFMERWVYDAY
eukprot:TRINITY_DN12985_c0_g1_i1.p1 TRINITY_DN12985_c0_g1~~TRINITY_DN12985_c0_g1_i1.p1  ORF type:complete len:221 (-),score=16.65 TRINITY_DN12985_c0_g1_i1:487-1149(-)